MRTLTLTAIERRSVSLTVAIATMLVVLPSFAGWPGLAGSRFNQVDGDGDGQITLAEIERWHRDWFASLDQNQDTIVNGEEIRLYVQQKQEARQSSLDQNNDGVVDQSEFLSHANTKAERRFKRLDRNANGVLENNELNLRKQKKRALRPRKLFRRFDANGDRQLNAAETLEVWRQWFQRRDTNGDGVITKSEITTVLKSRR